MILILGKGTLGSALHSYYSESVLIGRPEFDLSSQEGCDLLVEKFNPNIVINTVGINQNHNPWDILTTNFTSAVYLTLKFSEKMLGGHIINISSTSALWVSYPGIDSNRLCYNLSKENLSQFGRHFNRKISDDNNSVVLSTLEFGKFPSKFNNFQPGINLNEIIDVIDNVIKRPIQQVTIVK